MRLRLNLWQRLGIVASIVWAAGAYLAEMSQQSEFAARIAFDPCTAHDAWAYLHANCGVESYKAAMHDAWQAALQVALIPIPFVWLAVYIVIWTIRWVWAGRKVANIP